MTADVSDEVGVVELRDRGETGARDWARRFLMFSLAGSSTSRLGGGGGDGIGGEDRLAAVTATVTAAER